MEDYYHYNPKLRTFARQLRKTSTKAEILIWTELLRNCQCDGYRFLRQRPVLDYIADFMCKELNLIIEIDGITHHSEEAYNRDIMRENKLKEVGFHVLRFSDWEVKNDLGEVSVRLTAWIRSYEAEHPQVLELKRMKKEPRKRSS